MKKNFVLFGLVLSLLICAPESFAKGNYTYTTTTQESYSASSPIGDFYNSSATNTQPESVVTTSYIPSPYDQPVAVLKANVCCDNFESNYSESKQHIQTPQSYDKTVTKTESYRDERETADKIIDRGVKAGGILSVLGLVAALILYVI